MPSGLSNVVAIAAGNFHTLALQSDGTVAAWGGNTNGQTDVPANLSNVAAIAAGILHSVALKSDGTVMAWGYNENGQTDVPTGLNTVVAIAGGGFHTLALKSDGTVAAWGWNSYSQLNVPSGLSNVAAISGGGFHSLALAPNHKPVATAQTVSVVEDTAKTITLAGSDPDGDPITAYKIMSLPSTGKLYAGANTSTPLIAANALPYTLLANTVTYDPDSNTNGPDSFTFTVRDVSLESDPAAVTLNVAEVNDAPVVDVNGSAAGVNYSATFTEDGGSVPIVNTDALNGLTVSDVDGGNPNSARVTLHATPDGNAESLGADVTGTLLSASYSSLNRQLTISGTGSPGDYQKVLRTVRYNNSSPNPTTSNRLIDFVVNDGALNSATATTTLTITAVNDAPTLDALNPLTIAEDAAQQTVNLSGISSGGEVQTLTITATSDNPAVVPNPSVTATSANATGTLSFTPVANANGSATITVTVQDSGGRANGGTNSFERSFVVTVTEVNDAPGGSDDTLSAVQEDAATFGIPFATLLGNDSKGPANESGQNLTITGLSNVTGGSASIVGSNVQFTPAANYNGSAGFSYTLRDDGTTNGAPTPLNATATVSFTINAVNDAPVANAQSVTTAEDTTKDITLSGSDEEGNTLSYSAVQPAHGTLVLKTAPNVYTYTPASNYNGADFFTFTVNDGTATSAPATSAPATVSLTVTPVNDKPCANDGGASTNEDTSVGVDLSDFVADVETADANLTYEVVAALPAAQGTLSGTGASRTFTPATNFNGSTTFTYRVTDTGDPAGTPANARTSDTKTVTITVTGVNDAPVLSGISVVTPRNEGSATTVAGTVNDVDGGAHKVTINWGDGSANTVLNLAAGDTIFSANHTYADNGAYTIGITADDNSGEANATDSDSTSITVNNVALTVSNVAITSPVAVGTAATLSGDISDPGSDSFTLSINWGDGSAVQNFTLPAGSADFSKSHAYSIGGTYTINYTLTDDGGSVSGSKQVLVASQVSIGEVQVTEGNSGTSNASFTVSLNAANGVDVKVNYTTSNGNATQPDDYTSTSGILTIAAGQRSGTITVPVKGDLLDEEDETFTLTLSAPLNATIVDGTGEATIVDDDLPPFLIMGEQNQLEGDSGSSNMSFTVKLSASSGKQVKVNYSTGADTAGAPGDYTPNSGTLTFEAGQTIRSVPVTIVGDTVAEANEVFNFALNTPVNTTIPAGSGSTTGTIINDDHALNFTTPRAGASVTTLGTINGTWASNAGESNGLKFPDLWIYSKGMNRWWDGSAWVTAKTPVRPRPTLTAMGALGGTWSFTRGPSSLVRGEYTLTLVGYSAAGETIASKSVSVTRS